MVLKKYGMWVGDNGKESVTIFENTDYSFTAFHKNKLNEKVKVLECKGCTLSECVKTINNVFNTCISI